MPKRHKSTLKTENEVVEEIDRISDLPDAILAHIIGKLPTKYAVGTAVLSTRWKHLFPQIPNPDISIKDSEIMNPNIGTGASIRQFLYDRRKDNFIKFMHNLLNVTLHDVPRIRKFHLEFKGYFNEYVFKWVSTALKLNVSYLWVVGLYDKGETPESLFNCASLVEIMLNWNVGIAVPSSVFLPNLKCLYLKRVLFYNDDLRKVLSGCPVLEELCLCSCRFRVQRSTDTLVVRVFSPSVKKFEWFSCIKNLKYGIELDMPALNSLCYNDYVPEYFLVKNLNSLRKAYIDPKQCKDSQRELYLKNLADLAIGCSNVEFLSLTNGFVGAISCYFTLLKPFDNLIELVLPQIGVHEWQLLSYLLTATPSLEILVFANGFIKYRYKECYKIFLSHIGQCPTCLALNLQRIRFEEFCGRDDEMSLIKYFLENAKVLKKIEISFSLLFGEELLGAKFKVEALKKISKTCHIELIFGEQKKDDDNSFGMKQF